MSMDAAWASLHDDAEVADRHGYTPQPDDDDNRPILLEPLRTIPRPPPVLLNQPGMEKSPAPPPPPFKSVRSPGVPPRGHR